MVKSIEFVMPLDKFFLSGTFIPAGRIMKDARFSKEYELLPICLKNHQSQRVRLINHWKVDLKIRGVKYGAVCSHRWSERIS